MSRSVTSSFIAAVNAQTSSEVVVVLLTFSHADLADDIRISSDTTQTLPIAGVLGTVSNGDEYLYAPFELEMPSETIDGISRARITIDNVDRQIISTIRSIRGIINMSIQIVLASDPDTVEVAIDNFQLQNIDYDAMKVSADLVIKYFENEPCPATRFNPSGFPGLF